MDKRLLGRRLFLTAGIFLLFAPAFLVLGAARNEAFAVYGLPPLGAALLLALCARLLPARARVPGAMGAMLLAAAAAALWEKMWYAGSWLFLLPALCALAVGLCLWLLCRPAGEEVSVAAWLVGVAYYMAARIFGATARLKALPRPLRAALLLYLIYVVFALMLQSLRDGSGDGKTPAGRMLRRNCAMAAGFCALLLALVHWKDLLTAIQGALGAILTGIGWLLSLIKLPDRIGEPAAQEGSLAGLAAESGRASPFIQFLERLLYWIGAALAVALALTLLWLLGRLCVRGMKKLLQKLREWTGAVTDAYDDTVESLLDWGEVRRAARDRREKRRAAREKPVPWDRLTPREQVRRSYQAYLKNHPEIPDRFTARQALGDRAATDIYEKARYSAQPVTPREAEACAALRERSGAAGKEKSP